MKLHASVGADILSSINFPYPVVPIVRHHHENWDGSGYPDGLKGTTFQSVRGFCRSLIASTRSRLNRPYSPRLSNADATRILLDRRATMLDLSTSCGHFSQESMSSSSGGPGRAPCRQRCRTDCNRWSTNDQLITVPSACRLNRHCRQVQEEMLVLYDLARSLLGRLELADAADIISKHLRRIVPASTCVIFLYDVERDELVAAHASGDNAPHFAELRIPRGQRLTGWVAANKQSILNSDPVLDLGESARHFRPRLKSCLSTPPREQLRSRRRSVCLFHARRSVYRRSQTANRSYRQTRFRDPQTSYRVGVRDDAAERDDAQGLPSRERVERFVAAEIDLASTHATSPLSAFKSHRSRTLIMDVARLTGCWQTT